MRSASICAVLATLSLGACNPPSVYGLYVLEMATPEVSQTFDCQENFDEARCPEGEEPDDSDWTYTNSSTVSPAAEFVELMSGEADTAFLVFRARVYPGTVVDDAFTFTWTNQVASTYTSDFNGDYEYNTSEDATLTTKITLAPGEVDGVMTGKVSQVLNSVTTEEETDAPDDDESLVYVGQINDMASRYLENTADEEDPDGRVNTSEEEECGSSNCSITITENGETSSKATATFSEDQSIGDIGDYREVSQDEGVNSDDFIFRGSK